MFDRLFCRRPSPVPRRRDRGLVWRAVVGLFAGVLGLSTPARADLITIVAAKDNTLYFSSTGSLSNGAGDSMFVGTNNLGNVRRAVLSFDIAGSIPAGATINSASLVLQLTQTQGGQTIDMHRLTADWGEGTSVASGAEGRGAPSTTNDATWIHRFFNTQTWATAGGDFSPTVSASKTIAGLGSYTWTSSQLRADVQAMLDLPASNFGWIMLGDEVNAGNAARFATRENLTAAFRPMLVVNFAPVPEPGGLALTLVALGVFAGVGCRFRARGSEKKAPVDAA